MTARTPVFLPFLHAASAALLLTACASAGAPPQPSPDLRPGEASAEPPTVPPSGAEPADAPAFQPDDDLYLCPRIGVSNPPLVDAERRLLEYDPWVEVEGVRLLRNPVPGACLTSGFGPRGGRLHAGIDVQSRPALMVHAAGDGVVREAGFRQRDFGYYVLIDHGSGVFTRYAHLLALAEGVRPGERVSAGLPLGMMGNTPGPPLPVHLHYELLIGDYDTPRRSFGLEPVDVLNPAGGG